MPAPVLGIDLGTTNSVVAIVHNGKTSLLTDEQGESLFPSVVTQGDANTIWIGREAVALGAAVPGRTVYAAKRLIGRNFSDTIVEKAREMYPYKMLENPADGRVLIQLGDRQYSPEEISGMVLKDLKELAAKQFGVEAEEAIITVPAYFNHTQREATQYAAKLADLKVLRLLNEPTAAALSLPSQGDKERVIAVYDFGGGTFDISIIRIQGNVYEVLATNGDTFLGGDDVDGLICDELSDAFEKDTGVKLRNFPLSWHRLRDAAEKAKKELSHSNQCSVYLPRLVGDDSLSTKVTVDRVESMVRPLIERSIKICASTLEDATMNVSDLTEVILVGGQTRMPLIRKMVEEFFGRPPAVGVNPDTSVAEGAAREGAMLRQGEGALLLDVTPITLGINIVGNRLYPLIPKNTKIPVRREHMFTTHRDAQTRARMNILQGDSTVASENISLGEIILDNLRGFERFQSKLNVAFEIDASGILHVKAIDEDTGEEQEVVVRNSFEGEGKETAEAVPEEESVLPSEADTPPTISGPFRQTELVDVICFLHANEKTGRIDISSHDQSSSITLTEGEITHAVFNDIQGVDAVKEILDLKEGHYAFFEGASVTTPKDIDIPFDSLIL
jgi:molecular chaperone DnaK